jgi:ActR/RegA family two-component response regulator
MLGTATRCIDSIEVFVVDSHPQDYLQLATGIGSRGPSFQFAICASDALKLRRTAARSVWLVNIHLPDGSGCDLAAAIRARDPSSVVFLVGDEYDPAEELRARIAGGAMYVCKPAEAAWLSVGESPRPLSRCA